VDISARTDYAIRAMLMLAEEAQSQGLPIVVSHRGPSGGYTLSRSASLISLGEIFRAVDGPLAEVRGLRPHETSYEGVAQHLPEVWVAVRAGLRRVLDGTSLDQLLSGHLPADVRRLAQDPGAWQSR